MTFHPSLGLPRIPNVTAATGGARSVQEAAHRLLQRTAHLLASTPGGLRFEPGSRSWLVGLPGVARVSSSVPHPTFCA